LSTKTVGLYPIIFDIFELLVTLIFLPAYSLSVPLIPVNKLSSGGG